MTAAGRFSVVIVNRNGAGRLGWAAGSALNAGVAAGAIVVVDNGSTDSSLSELPSGVRVVRGRCNAGFARAVNRGLRTVNASEFVLLLNNDAALAEGALEAFAAAFDSSPGLVLAGGQLRYPDGRLQSAFAPLPTLLEEVVPRALLRLLHPERYRRSTSLSGTRQVETVFGACLAVRSSALPQIGLLDEDFFFYFEEVEWCRRARLRGGRVAYVAGAGATHLLGHTAHRNRAGARIELERSKLIYFQKCAGRGSYLLLSGLLLVRSGINAAFGLLHHVVRLGRDRGRWEKTQAYLRLFRWHLQGRPEGGAWGLPDRCPAGSEVWLDS